MKKILLVACLALGACVTSGKRGGDAAMAIYDLGPPGGRQETVSGLSSVALEIRAPYGLDSSGIQYRLLYAEPGRLRDYAQARWVAPPATLIQQRLAQRLGLVPLGQGGTACLLRIDLDEFSQSFDSPQSSQGILQARVTLLDHSRNKLAGDLIRIEKRAPSQDSQGGVAALVQAVEQLGADLGRWQGELASNGRFKACGK